MIPTPSTPPPAALGESPLVVPRGPDVDLARTVEAGADHWPPVPVARLELRQAWLPQPEAALRPGHVGLAATAGALLVFAELTDDCIHTLATADHEPLWERGDVFEIFLQSFGADQYFELQIAPLGHRLHLHYPRSGAVRAHGIAPYIQRDRAIEFTVRVEPARARWRVAARIPIASLLARHPRSDGAEWRGAFCRYDYDAAGQFCLSSTAALTRPDFHRSSEWSRLSIPGGFPAGPPF